MSGGFNIAALIDELRSNAHVPPDALAAIELAYETFKIHSPLCPGVAAQAFGFGLIVGSFLDGKERADETNRLRQSIAGHASSAKRQLGAEEWRAHAEELAKAIRAGSPSTSQDTVASEIQARWRLAEPHCPEHTTIKSFIRELEKSGELPTRQKKQK